MVALHRRAPVQLMAGTILFVRDGTEIAIAGSVVPIRTAKPGIQGALLVFQESEEQQGAAALHAQDQQAEEDRQSQRLRVLAGGIAHNFNNLLAAVLGNAELVRFDILEEHLAHGRWRRSRTPPIVVPSSRANCSPMPVTPGFGRSC
jgi:signal transduction histidine kinase